LFLEAFMCFSLSSLYDGIEIYPSTSAIDMFSIVGNALGYTYFFEQRSDTRILIERFRRNRNSDTIYSKALNLFKAVPGPIYGASASALCHLMQASNAMTLGIGTITTAIAYFITAPKALQGSLKC
jgi:hypothetical protein